MLVQLISLFIRDYIDTIPNDVKNNLKTLFVSYGRNSQFDLRITAHFGHSIDLELLSKQATYNIEDRYDMVGDWEYKKLSFGKGQISTIDFVYKHEIDTGTQALEVSLKKAFSDYGDNVTISIFHLE